MSAEDPKGPVILCWDGSSSASRSIEHAARILGQRRRAIVLFAHVPVEAHGGVVDVLTGRPSPDAPIMGAADAEGLLEEGVRIAGEAGFEASGLRIAADRKTAEIIVETAKEQDAMLVVMGQRGRTGLKSTLLGLGSVAQQVLGTYGGAVLLVGPTPA
ncbi:MAG: universal stress protein [Solirubrobacterales bacterium]|nr:universal stress protein [Solirubrobacterales bacterium]